MFLLLLFSLLFLATEGVDFAVAENSDLLVCQGAFCTIWVVSQVVVFFCIVIVIIFFFCPIPSFDTRLVSFFGWMSVCAREVFGLEGL